MRLIALCLAFVPLATLPAAASEPGQPLDCSDWVFLEPGLSCGVEIAAGNCPYESCGLPSRFVDIDNAGARYSLRRTQLGYCPCGGQTLQRTSLVRMDGGEGTVVAYIEGRCVPGGTYPSVDLISSPELTLVFDRTNGKMLIPLISNCYDCGNGHCPYIGAGTWLSGIVGFSSAFEIFQSYTPQASLIDFRVPAMPEGLAAADHFDTYYGPLTKPINFANAQPLACDYPAAVPAVGDYLEVADPLPDPAPGTGRYYVTSATYEGQARYGRKTTGGVLSGRDPALLPACAK